MLRQRAEVVRVKMSPFLMVLQRQLQAPSHTVGGED
jgi:hypothetical protein